jgi:meso-butanediol dehydrogenase/(S,S)-butanediol dehydrogenase/diacetyl reductase
MSSLQDKCAIVTGGGRGIGAAIARTFAADGASVIVASVTEENAKAVTADIQSSGGRAIAVQVDVRDRAGVRRMIEAATSAFGRLDVLVNNAGVAQAKPFLEITEEDWRGVSDVNALGTLICMQEAITAMIALGVGGKIVNVSSLAGKQGFEPLAHYSASKFAVIGLTQAAARAFAGHGVTVNAICPGVIATDMWRTVDQGFRDHGLTTAENEAFDAFAAAALLRRPGAPADVTGVARFLASSDSDFITGQSLIVDGGIFLN